MEANIREWVAWTRSQGVNEEFILVMRIEWWIDLVNVWKAEAHALKAYEEEEVEGREVFLISREVIIGYLAEILILQAEGGASKCAKDDGGWSVIRCKQYVVKKKEEEEGGRKKKRNSPRIDGRTGGSM